MNITFIIKGVAVVAIVSSSSCLPGPPPPPGDDPPRTGVLEDPSNNPLRDLAPELQRTFDKGDADFEARFFPAQGLGPLYIRTACASCHAGDGKGPGFVTKMVVLDDDGAPVPASLPFGGTVRPFFEAPATRGIAPPDVEGVFLSTRMGPSVFGRGYLEAIAESELERVAAEQAAAGDGVTGRVHRVTYNSKPKSDATFNDHVEGQTGLVGRFGGLEISLYTEEDQITLNPHLELFIYSKSDRWLYLLEGKGLEEQQQLRTKSWKTNRTQFPAAPELVSAVAGAVERLGLQPS